MQFYEHNNILIYPTQSPFLMQAVPEAKLVNGKYLAIPKNLHNLQILRHFNHPVPPVITDANYDWPIEPGKTPGEHQKVMANFDVLNRRCYNLSDPGTQKTLAKLWAADWLMRQFPPKKCRCLIVAPLTILETVWAKAIFSTFLGSRTVEILSGTAEKRQLLLAKKPDFAIINFDGVRVGARLQRGISLGGLSADLANDKEIQIVIVDEVDNYCDAQTARHRVARLVLGQRPYLWVQTGTPTGNAPTDAYGIAKLVNNALGKSFTSFREDTMYKVSMYKWLPRKDGYDKACQLLSPAIRYDIKEVWKDAPEFVMEPRKVELTPSQIKALKALQTDLQIQIKGGKIIDVPNEAAARNKFLQIVQGQIYDSSHKAHEIDAAPRYNEIKYLVSRAARKVVIFASLTSVVEYLYKLLSKDWHVEIINGATKNRADVIQAFAKDANFKVVICDPQTTSHGINEFVVADTPIWAGPTDKTRLYIQGNKRLHRPGQTYPVRGFQIIATKLEQEIYRRLETNTTMQGVMLDAIREGSF